MISHLGNWGAGSNGTVNRLKGTLTLLRCSSKIA
jgi:hypothetical protein